MIGERIGHLRVIASIGVGGMGAVWHAVDELLDRHVALKVIRPELMSRPGLAERFRSEAIVLARLQHPCIAALYGLEKRGDEFVMVMEYVDGQTLDLRVAQQGLLPWPEATRITRAVLDALDHAHESGVIHRDIKPSNVMITRAGRVKVMDFGIARLVGAERQTRTGAAVGTPSYMSPEQLLGQEVDGRADVYAVGTLLYELATGHLPFEVEGDYLRMIAQLQEIPRVPSTHVPELPPGLDRIVARALQKEPDDRYATSGDFRDALEELEREHGVLRPYGTPAAGSSTVQSSLGVSRGTPAGFPAIEAQPASKFAVNPAALLTPVDSASSVTPVPFSIEPASATPIELEVPVSHVKAPVVAPANVSPANVSPANVSPANVSPASVSPLEDAPVLQPASIAADVIVATVTPPKKRSAMRRAVFASLAIAAVALIGVQLSRGLTASENAAGAAAADSARTPPLVPPTVPPAVPASMPEQGIPLQPEVLAVSDTADSASAAAAAKKVIADSMRALRKARADSARAKRDSAAAASVFSLPGAGAALAPVEAEAIRRTAESSARRAASECVTMLNARDMSRLESLFGGDKRDMMRIVKDGKLEASGPLGTTVEIDGDRATARFAVTLSWQNANGESRSARGSLRAIVERAGNTWATKRCLVDNDGGARF